MISIICKHGFFENYKIKTYMIYFQTYLKKYIYVTNQSKKELNLHIKHTYKMLFVPIILKDIQLFKTLECRFFKYFTDPSDTLTCTS